MSDSKVAPMSGTESTAPIQVSRGDSIVWKHYIQLTRMHMWPLGSDAFWFAMSTSSNGYRMLYTNTKLWFTVWGLLMTAYRTGLPLRTVSMDALVLAVAATFCHNASCIWNDICDRDIDGRVGMYT